MHFVVDHKMMISLEIQKRYSINKNNRWVLPVLPPKKSLNSLSIRFVLAEGTVVGGGGRELVAPSPQGSDILTERLVSLVAIVWLFPLHGLACGVGAIELSHGSFDTVVAEVCPFDSNVHGSSMRKKSNYYFLFV